MVRYGDSCFGCQNESNYSYEESNCKECFNFFLDDFDLLLHFSNLVVSNFGEFSKALLHKICTSLTDFMTAERFLSFWLL